MKRTPPKRSGPVKRSKPMKRRPRRTRARHDPQYLARVHELPCVCCGWGANVEVAHMTLGRNQKGIGMKTPDRNAIPMCHLDHVFWDQRREQFKGWSDDLRYAQAALWVRRTQEALGGVY